MVYNMFQNTYNGIQYTVYSYFFAGENSKENFYYIYINIYIIIYITCVI